MANNIVWFCNGYKECLWSAFSIMWGVCAELDGYSTYWLLFCCSCSVSAKIRENGMDLGHDPANRFLKLKRHMPFGHWLNLKCLKKPNQALGFWE